MNEGILQRKGVNTSSVFTLREMAEATCSFSDENLLAKGGFGRVYKGTLRSGEVVAIKKMELLQFKEAEGEQKFQLEVEILSRSDHPNLVTLIRDRRSEDGLVCKVESGYWSARGLAYLHSSSGVGISISTENSNPPTFFMTVTMKQRFWASKGYARGSRNMCDRLHILNDKKKLKKVINQEMERGSYTTESIAMFAE